MKRSITIDNNHIELLSKMVVREFTSTKVGVDLYDLYGGSFVYQDIANIIGLRDKVIPESLEDCDGPMYDEETQAKLEEIDGFIHDHLPDLIEITLQFSGKGGLKAGKYVCDENVRIWEFKG